MTKPSRFETRPLYLQVRDMLLGRITTGNWKPGTLIPNEVELAREFGLSVGTVRKALDQLQAEHLLTRRQGRGTFVNDLSSGEHASRFFNLHDKDGKRLVLQSKLMSVELVEARDDDLRHLELSKGSNVINLVRLKSRGAQVCMYEKSTVPATMFPELHNDTEIPDEIAALAQKYGQIVGSAEEFVSIVKADADAAGNLSVEPGTALMGLQRRAFDMDGVPIEWRSALCHNVGGFYRSQIT